MSGNHHLELLRFQQELSYVNESADGRFLFAQAAHDHLRQPLVSNFLFQQGFRPQYPGGRTFGVCVSHDVDFLHQPNFFGWQRVKAPLRELSEGYPGRAARYFLNPSGINPYWNIDKVLDFEHKKGVNSSFFFLSLQKHEQDFNYHTGEIKSIFKEIVSAGGEIGLHGGHRAFADPDKLSREKSDLERDIGAPVVGYRNHFLRLDVSRTFGALEALSFEYDTTYGFADYPAYRNGLCYPFPVWSVREHRELSLLEIPLTAMDVTFSHYLKWTPARALDFIRGKIDEIAAVQGVFTLLWHNSLYIGDWGKVYRKVIDYCRQKEAWFATGKQMCDWWNLNQYGKTCLTILENPG